MKINQKAFWLTLGAAIFIFLLIPYLTNLLMFIKPFHLLVPTGVAKDNVWIGYIATYYGAIIGGLISGLFTYLGVYKTLFAQKKKSNEDHKQNHRAILELQEIYDGELFLRNIKNKKGRLIITSQYKNAIDLDLSDAHFNYISLRNSGPGKAFNCSIKVEIEYINPNEVFTINLKIPLIFETEDVYVPIDKITDENGQLLSGRKYFIKRVDVEYETYAKETIKIIRLVEEVGSKRVVTDRYNIKYNSSSNYVHLYDIEGSENEWYFLENNDK